jgi:hypothetical protein
MSVLLYDPAKDEHVLLLQDGPWANKRWSVDLAVCVNPFCRCANVDFRCIPEGAADHQAAPVRFSLDTQTRSIDRGPGRGGDAVSDSLSESVVRELGDPGWQYLREYLLVAKQEQIENCDVKRSDADFPPEVLRGEVTTVGFSEIFPLAAAFSFTIGSEQWVAVDDYCVNPDCDCHHAVLQFVTLEHKRGLLGLARKIPPAMYYDYRDRTFEDAGGSGAHEPSLKALLDGVRDEWPDLESRARKRHRMLKALFKRALRKYESETDRSRSARDSRSTPSPQSPLPKPGTAIPGRNDPCPCGSGKKYKKCCGR